MLNVQAGEKAPRSRITARQFCRSEIGHAFSPLKYVFERCDLFLPGKLVVLGNVFCGRLTHGCAFDAYVRGHEKEARSSTEP